MECIYDDLALYLYSVGLFLMEKKKNIFERLINAISSLCKPTFIRSVQYFKTFHKMNIIMSNVFSGCSRISYQADFLCIFN